MPSYTTVLATALALFSVADAHMKMKTPAPYGGASLNNSPLDASGSDFPCKQRPGVYDPPSTKNMMPIGVDNVLSFEGSAVHGGGSCQISLTKDLKPTKDSKWMVIHSIEGGCPAKAAGNIGDDPHGSGAAKFQYKIPQGIAPGDYTLAWTWFNKIGNREMYMNCAPITVTGGSKKRDVDHNCHNSTETYNNATETYASDEVFDKRDATFPEMFKANIPASDCTTPESKDIAFPNPGASVEKSGDAASMGQPTGPKCGAASSGSSGSSSGSSGSSSGNSAAAAAPAAPAAGASGSTPSAASGSGSAPAGAASPATTSVVAIPPAGAPSSGQAGAAVSVASAAASVASAAASVASGASAPAATGSSSSSASGSAPASGGAAGMSTGSCSSPGQSVCSPDGMKIGTCDNNKNVVFMAVAPGTKCMGGQMVMAGTAAGKRSAKFAKAYRA
ncbi:MAG: hypothetical protein Q9219_004576 [cf. Caloplaca sp. 3 TL-2023]